MSGMRYGRVCPRPPRAVINPQMNPRISGRPRPVRLPSSESASANPMLMPAPTVAASPTRNVSQLLAVAKAAANSGASVETEPSISPASPGWMTCRTNSLRRVSSSPPGGDSQRVGDLLVLALLLGEVAQQPARRDALGPPGRRLVELLG